MITELLFLGAIAFSQDPKPAPRTVEERLKELEDKIGALEKKQQTLTQENAALEKKAADAKALRETHARQVGPAWIKTYGTVLELAEKQSVEIQELWHAWTKEDFEKPYDPDRWKNREETLRGKLTPEQATRLGRKVREDQEQYAKRSVSTFVQTAKLPAERGPDLEKIVMARLTFPDSVLLTQAQSQKDNPWFRVLSAVEEALPEMASILTPEEQIRLRDTVARWKPRK